MKKNFSIFIIILIFSSCIEEDFFGFSSEGNIREIEVSNQANQASIDREKKRVEIEMPIGIDLSNITVNKLSLSSFAESDVKVGDVINFNDSVQFNITAEDGSVTSWYIVPLLASATPQLPNSNFDLWYESQEGYFEPGENASSTIWGTGNPGTQLLGLYATTPIEISPGNFAARLETLDNGRFAGSLGFPISSATIYTGKFVQDNLDPTDPEAAIDFGTTFSGRPKSMKIKYQYSPGDVNKDKEGNVLPETDQCDIYCLLEVRTGDKVQRLATVWFRSSETVDELSELLLDFNYGPLPDEFPDYAKPDNGQYVSVDSAQFILPSHIVFVAASSYNGANFGGAIGSTLLVDDLEFIY